MDLEFRKKHNPTYCTVSSRRGFIVEVAERVTQRSGDSGSRMGKELSEKVEGPQTPPPFPNPSQRPPTSKTVAPCTKSACLPLGLDPVLCPQDDSHTSKWRPVRSQEPRTSANMCGISQCVCACVCYRRLWEGCLEYHNVTVSSDHSYLCVCEVGSVAVHACLRVCMQVACLLSIR